MTDEEEIEDCKSRENEPGASRHGNFINYYKFHSAEERAKQLPTGLWRWPASHCSSTENRKFLGLDVGCNSGDLTVLLSNFLRNELKDETEKINLLGIDMDASLIGRARENHGPKNPEIFFECLDIMGPSRDDILKSYLTKHGSENFDVIFSFSITMWIHLNHGDEGLIDFLTTICSHAKKIVLEPQPWKCYRNASRRMRRAGLEDFRLLNSLKLTGDVAAHIDRIILDRCPFRPVDVTQPNEWGRKLLIYERL